MRRDDEEKTSHDEDVLAIFLLFHEVLALIHFCIFLTFGPVADFRGSLKL